MNNKSVDIRHQLLGELHHLLSIATAEDFYEASLLCKSENIKLALEALAEEHRNSPAKRAKRLPLSKARPDGGNESRYVMRANESDVLEILLNSRRFARKSDLLEFARMHGANFKVTGKESRERVALKLGKAIERMAEEQKRMVYSRLLEDVDPQTFGWARVIKQNG